MARLSELTSLFHAVAAANWQRARSVALEIVTAEEQAGHHTAATRLRGALAATGPTTEPSGVTEAVPSLAVPELLTLLPPADLAKVKLPEGVRLELARVTREHRHRDRLEPHGLVPRGRLFFSGPPGCGKTLTARALGGELGMPVLAVRFEVLVGSYLGQTAMRLSEVFRYAAAQRCILLLDEIDAVGRIRGKTSDVGELDRVVISLMQQLDFLPPAGLLIAASNVPQQLDPALLRRFDVTLEFPEPSPKELAAYAKEEAKRRGIKLVNGARHDLAAAKTFADAERIVESEHRSIILRDE